ncbi:hypothetical protein MMC18_003517 [Xylographa bjoerkii]|nr:hypothetical protein [Xylographa bjoerkii]
MHDLEVFEKQTGEPDHYPNGGYEDDRLLMGGAAALRYELDHDHTYDFVDGVVPRAMNTAIEGVSKVDDEYFVYYEAFDRRSFDKAVQDLGRYVADEGPFEGVIAFSHGCSLAAAFLLEQQRQCELDGGGQAAPFKCAVFLCGRLPYIDAGEARHGTGADGVIRIPTAHVWGGNDQVEPGQGLALSGICEVSLRSALEHGGGHEVPGSRDTDTLIGSVHTITRMLKRVLVPPSDRCSE